MTEPDPYAPLPPMTIPAGHPILDAGGFSDAAAAAVNQPAVLDYAAGQMRPAGPTGGDAARAQVAIAQAGPTAAELAAAVDVLAKAGISVPTPPALLAGTHPARRAPAPQLCTHPDGCTNPATHQTQRPATPEEAEKHWAGLEGNIRASNDGHDAASYVADRTDTVVKTEYRCDDPGHADPQYLEALGNQGTESGAA